ncbi:MAG: hypothetical protein U5K54_24750 [Cytophagales bacterium]|nr:hypothetical protein [Cytophagales bacterium]
MIWKKKSGLYMAEDYGRVGRRGRSEVSEYVEMDVSHDFGIGLDASLHLETISASTY